MHLVTLATGDGGCPRTRPVGHPDLTVQSVVVDQSMYSATAISRSSTLLHGPLLRTSSVLNSELNASARALTLLYPSSHRWICPRLVGVVMGAMGLPCGPLPGAESGLQPGVGGAVSPRVRHHRSRADDRDRLVLRVLQPPAPAQRHRRHVTDQLRDHRPHPRSGIREPSTISGEPQRWATCISATSGPGTCAGRVLRPPPAVRKRQRTGTGIGAHAQQGTRKTTEPW
jgi:hypothetical protein